jgi:spermidine/putrescine transport system permease protein
MLRNKALLVVCAAPAVIVSLAPVVATFLISFCNCRFPITPWPGWSNQWYVAFSTDADLQWSILMSLAVASVAATIGTAIGFPAGYEIARLPSRGSIWLVAVLTLPALIPGFLYGMSLLAVAQAAALQNSLALVTLAHAVIYSPIALAIGFNRSRQLDPAIEDAAMELGSSRFRLIAQIVGRQVWPSAAAAFLFIFVLSMDEYVVAWFLSGFAKTYPVQIRNMLESSISPEVDAASVFVLLATWLLFAVAAGLFRLSNAPASAEP